MRVKYRGEPDPVSAWDEIIPGLFMGGHIRRQGHPANAFLSSSGPNLMW
jgi:hypothetical protein